MFGKKAVTRNALILHGTDDGPQSHWFPWLKNQLAWRGFDVEVPQLPQADEPDTDRYWDRVLSKYSYNDKTVIVGHSSGAVASLRILERLPANVRPRLVVLVAGFYKDEGWNCEGLFKTDFDWQKIRSQAQQIEVWWSNDDPYISEEQTNFLAEQLQIQADVFGGYGHFSKDVTMIPELAEEILN